MCWQGKYLEAASIVGNISSKHFLSQWGVPNDVLKNRLTFLISLKHLRVFYSQLLYPDISLAKHFLTAYPDY